MKVNKLPKNISLVLSGGGARGAIHVGVLKAMEEHHIKIKAISGTSMGAIVGVLYCQGIPADEILKILTNNSFFNLFNYNWDKGGLLSMKRIKNILDKHIPHNDFHQLKIPFFCCATNLNSAEYKIFNSGDLQNSVLASASIPIVFKPVKINKNLYIDGGLFNNLPIQPLIENGFKNIVGVHADNCKHSDNNDTYDIADKVFAAILKHNVNPNLAKCDYVIEPYLEKHYGTLDFKKMKELYEIGYRECKLLLEQIL